MKMNSTVRCIALMALIFCLITAVASRPYDAKLHFCRKYIYAPRCRGAQAKRDIAKLEPLLEDARSLQENYDDLSTFQNKQWQENESNKNRLLDTLSRKINPRGIDYDTGTDDYLQ